MSYKTLHEVKQMSLLFQRDSIFRTHSKHKGHPTITLKDPSHPEQATTKNTQTGSCLPQFSRLLQEIHQKFCKSSQHFNTIDMPASEIFTGHQPTMKPSCTSRNPSLKHLYYITLTLTKDT